VSLQSQKPVPLRGEIWDVAIPVIGPHPAVVLTINVFRERFPETTVALITGTAGPRLTHIPVGPASGLTRYAESYVNVTNLFSLPTEKLRRRRGLLHRSELLAVEDGVRFALGLSTVN
jgi:mRNA interferase MazF